MFQVGVLAVHARIFLRGEIAALIYVFLCDALLKAHRDTAHARNLRARAVAPLSGLRIELRKLGESSAGTDRQ